MPETPCLSAPLRLSGTSNTRDLGGYPAADGRAVQSHQFLRSDAPVELPEEDLAALYDYGVRCVIDLRSPGEVRAMPCSLAGYRDVEYCGCPLSDQVHSDDGASAAEAFPETMGKMYIGLLDRSGSTLAAAMRAILRHPEDCVLFHCTAGKDRTGTLAMLLLQLAGVPDGDIVRDYAATEGYMLPWFEVQQRLHASLGVLAPEHVFRSEPANMEEALAHLHTVYGGAEGYLRHIGLDGAEIAALRQKLLGP